MKTLSTDVTVKDDGVLRLELPANLPPGPAEVVLVIQPKAAPVSGAKACSGLFLGRSTEELDIDSVLGDLNSQWKRKLGIGE